MSFSEGCAAPTSASLTLAIPGICRSVGRPARSCGGSVSGGSGSSIGVCVSSVWTTVLTEVGGSSKSEEEADATAPESIRFWYSSAICFLAASCSVLRNQCISSSSDWLLSSDPSTSAWMALIPAGIAFSTRSSGQRQVPAVELKARRPNIRCRPFRGTWSSISSMSSLMVRRPNRNIPSVTHTVQFLSVRIRTRNFLSS